MEEDDHLEVIKALYEQGVISHHVVQQQLAATMQTSTAQTQAKQQRKQRIEEMRARGPMIKAKQPTKFITIETLDDFPEMRLTMWRNKAEYSFQQTMHKEARAEIREFLDTSAKGMYTFFAINPFGDREGKTEYYVGFEDSSDLAAFMLKYAG